MVVIKLLHSSDWHLGKSLFSKSLLEDQAQALQELETLIATEKPSAVLLAGDLYDRSVPPEDAVRILDQFLAKVILELRVPVVMIPGNHDSSTRLGVSAGLLHSSGLHIFASPHSITSPLQIESGTVKASIYGIPFLEPNEWGFFFDRPLRTHNDALIAILEKLEPLLAADRADGRRTVLVMHAYVTGGEPSESERPLSIGGSDLVSAELLEKFDYVALGHLHRPQTVLHERIRYPGSLFPYSQSEASQPKGALIACLNEKRPDDEFRFAEFKSTRGLRVLRGALEELIRAGSSTMANSGRPDDYIIAVLTDSSLPFEAYRRLHALYPGLLHVARDVNWTREDAETADAAARTMEQNLSEASDQDILSQFIAAVSNGDVSNEDREWLVQQLEAFNQAERAGTFL